MKKDDIYRSQFRLPYSLYERLKESAETNNRSVNAELIARLEHSFYTEDLISKKYEEMQEQIDEIREKMKNVKFIKE